MWNWLNGKKTNIGAAAAALFALAKAVGVQIDPGIEGSILTVIGFICGGGLVHKAVKKGQ